MSPNWKLGNLRNLSFTSSFDSNCNWRFKNDNKNELKQKRWEEKMKIFEIFEFSILLYTQNWVPRELSPRKITPPSHTHTTLKLTLTLIQTLTLIGGQFSSRAIVRIPQNWNLGNLENLSFTSILTVVVTITY